MLTPQIVLLVFRIYAECGMWDTSQTLFGDQLTSSPANTIGFVFNPDQCIFQVLDKFTLAGSKPAVFLLR